jgi:hypothetical protein
MISFTLWHFLAKLVFVMKSGFYLLLSCLARSRSFRLYLPRDLLLYSLKY